MKIVLFFLLITLPLRFCYSQQGVRLLEVLDHTEFDPEGKYLIIDLSVINTYGSEIYKKIQYVRGFTRLDIVNVNDTVKFWLKEEFISSFDSICINSRQLHVDILLGILSKTNTIEYLSIVGGGINYLSDDLIKIGGLKTLVVQNTHLSKLPMGLSKLENLSVLDFSYNNELVWDSVQASISGLPIESLSLRECGLKGFPLIPKDLTSLKVLDLFGNRSIDLIPEYICDFPLNLLDLGRTNVHDIPDCLKTSSTLEYFVLWATDVKKETVDQMKAHGIQVGFYPKYSSKK